MLPLIVISIVLFGISVFFRKLAVDKVSPFQIQVISAFIYTALAPIWVYFARKNGQTEYDSTGVFYAVTAVVLATLAMVCFGFCLKQTDNPGVISALISLNPVITMGLSVLFLHEQLTPIKVLAFVLALVSAVLVNL